MVLPGLAASITRSTLRSTSVKWARCKSEIIWRADSGESGPAAFFTGEKLYQTEDFPFAEKHYGEILRRYPKSEYASYAIERIEQLNKQQLYQPQEFGFHPWRILSIIDNP